MLCKALQSGGGDVDGGDVPAVGGEPDGVAAFAAAQVQGTSGRRELGCGFGEYRVGVALPRGVFAAVEVVPEPGRLGRGLRVVGGVVHRVAFRSVGGGRSGGLSRGGLGGFHQDGQGEDGGGHEGTGDDERDAVAVQEALELQGLGCCAAGRGAGVR